MSDYPLCSACERPMRPYQTAKGDHRGTVARATVDMCHGCYDAARRAAMTYRVDTDGPCVLVRTDLRPSTYRVFAEEAKRRGLEVGDLLSLLADRAVPKPPQLPVKPPQAPREPQARGPRDDVDRRILELNAAGYPDRQIAEMVRRHQTSVMRRRRAMGAPTVEAAS